MRADLVEAALADLPSLQRLAFLVCAGDSATAEDVLQNLFVKLLRARGRADVVAVRPYLRRALIHEYVTWRRRWRDSESLSGDEPSAVLAPVEDRLLLLDVLRQLSPLQRTVLVLRYLEDWPDEAIADAIARKVTTVRSLAARGLAKVRVILSQLEDSPKGAIRE